jgi:hypothetical protein
LGIGTTSTANYILRVNAASPLFGMMVSGTQAFTIGALSGGGGAFYYGAGNAEAARIDSSGNVGIGTSSPATKLHVSSGAVDEVARFQGTGSPYISMYRSGTRQFYIYNTASATELIVEPALPLTFATSGTERARITSDGNVRIGSTTGGTRRMQVESASANFTIGTLNTDATPYSYYAEYSTSPNNTGSNFFQAVDSTTIRVDLRSNGGIANYQANNVNLSDRREKTNFASAKSYLDIICAIPVQTFNYIDQNHEKDPGLTLGVVAQDVQAVAPELVMESNWAKQGDEPKMRLSIYQTDLQYALMKCIQEQQALINSLKARLDAANL